MAMFFSRKKLSVMLEKNARVRNAMFFLVFALGIAIGMAIEWRRSAALEKNAVFDFRKIHPLNSNFKFINPLLGFDAAESKYSEYAPLKREIEAFTQKPDVAKIMSRASIYFRNLESGEWVGIHEDDEFNPASLFKVPVMMLYLKLAESNPDILNKTYFYTAKDANLLKSVSGGEAATTLIEGKPYTVETLIREMIARSDNMAKYLLILNSPGDDLRNLYGDLGVQNHGEQNYTISTKTYSLFFRTLYNATFLNREMSEKALVLLSEAEFKDGLVAGVPSGIKVAHKYGRYATIENGKVMQVEAHNCGIVYYPGVPYLLCVMTRGSDTKQLERIIYQISKLTYDFLEKYKEQ